MRFKKRRGAASFTALRASVACCSPELTRPTVSELEAGRQRLIGGLALVVPFLALPVAAAAPMLIGVG